MTRQQSKMEMGMFYDELECSVKLTDVCKKCGKEASRIVSHAQSLTHSDRRKDIALKNDREIGKKLREFVAKDVKRLKKHFICGSCYRDKVSHES